MLNLFKNAPGFENAKGIGDTYTVYRFVDDDSYFGNINVGDIYQDPSFTSTTRNPYYYKENYTFGYILIKINLPLKTQGIGLCIESYSNFPNEEEIILTPKSRYRLDNIIDTRQSQQLHYDLRLKVEKKYECTWIGKDYLKCGDEIKIDIEGV